MISANDRFAESRIHREVYVRFGRESGVWLTCLSLNLPHNNYIILRQNSGVNAEYWGNILGTRATLEVTYQLQQKGLDTSETGYGSARRVREYLYHPDDIKALQTGRGIFLLRDTNTHWRVNIHKPF